MRKSTVISAAIIAGLIVLQRYTFLRLESPQRQTLRLPQYSLLGMIYIYTLLK